MPSEEAEKTTEISKEVADFRNTSRGKYMVMLSNFRIGFNMVGGKTLCNDPCTTVLQHFTA